MESIPAETCVHRGLESQLDCITQKSYQIHKNTSFKVMLSAKKPNKIAKYCGEVYHN